MRLNRWLFLLLWRKTSSNIPNRIVLFYKKDVTLESQKDVKQTSKQGTSKQGNSIFRMQKMRKSSCFLVFLFT